MSKGANNVPIHAPLFPDPFVPYECKNYISLFAIVEANEAEIKRIISYTPFEYVSNKVVISITDFSNTDKVSFMDCAFVIPVKYEQGNGGYYFYEYENNDAAIAAGRDLWGYPKKYANISLTEENGIIHGIAKKNGEPFLEMKAGSNEIMESKVTEPITTPHFNIRTIPKPNGEIFLQEIIERDTSPDFVLHEKTFNDVSIKINPKSIADPLELLEPIKILGGGIVRGDFYATEENGWGKVIKTL